MSHFNFNPIRLKLLWQRHWVMGFIIFSMVFVLANVVNLAMDIGRPFGGVLTTYSLDLRQYHIQSRNPDWWPVIASGQLQHGDRLLTINGLPYNGPNEQMVFATAYAQGHDTVTIVAQSEQGQGRVVSIPIALFTLTHLLDIQLSDFMTSLALWFLALVIYRSRPSDPLNRIVAVLICILVLYGADRHSVFWRDGWETWIFSFMSRFRNGFIGVLLIHFALLFPTPLPIKRSVLYALYSLASFFVLCRILSLLIIWRTGSATKWAIWLHNTGENFWFLTVLGIIAVLVRMFLIWRQKETPLRHRWETGGILVGGLLSSLMTWVQFGSFLGINNNLGFIQYLDLRYLQLLIPITLAALILRHHTFQTPPRRLLFAPILIALSAFIANISTAILLWTQPQIAQPPASLTFLILFLAILLASILWYTQSSEQGWFGRLLHRKHLGYAAVRRFGQTLIEHRELAELPGYITQTLCNELELEQAAVWLWHDEDRHFRLMGRAGKWIKQPPAQLTVSPDQPLISTLPLHLKGAETIIPTWLQPLKQTPAVEVMAPLLVSGQPVGLLVLGKRWDEALFNERDLEIIELIGQQASLALLTAQQVEQLRQVPHQVTQAQERERYKISGELHDTIQQFLGRLPFYLERSRDMMNSNPQEAAALLKTCITDVGQAAKTVRHIRINLAPSQLEFGLVPALVNLIDRFRLDTGIEVVFEASPELDLLLPLDTRHALYRVVQQALDNIRDHAQAHHVIISLERDKKRICYCIKDDGIGASAEQIAQAQLNESFGLRSMEYRIKSVAGQFTFNSVPTQGTQIIGWVPAKPP